MKKNENLDSKLQILTLNQEIFKNPRKCSFFFIFSFQTSFFFIFLARGTWNPGKPWKSMKNNGKSSKTKENEKMKLQANEKMKLQMKKMKFKANENNEVANEKNEVENEKMKLKMKQMKFDGKRWWTKTQKMQKRET